MLKFSQKTFIFGFIAISMAFFITSNAFAQTDTDRDGYSDDTEAANNYDPFSPCGKNTYEKLPFSYGKGRLVSRTDEQCRARFLKAELERLLGKGNLNISAKNWHTVVNAFIYGGYRPEEIAAVIKFHAPVVHPSIPKATWKNSNDYRKAIANEKIAKFLDVPQPVNTFSRGNSSQPIVVESKRKTSLDPKTILFGNIYDQMTKQPLNNTELKLYVYTNSQKTEYKYLTNAKSDGSGNYQLTYEQFVSLDKSNLFVRVEKAGYGGSDYNFTFDRYQIREVDFSLTHSNRNQVQTDDTPVYENKLLTVTLTDSKNNPLYNVAVTMRIDETAAKALTLNSPLAGTSGVDGSFVIAGTIDPKFTKSIPAYLTFSHPLLKEKSETKIDIKGKKDLTIKFDYVIPDTIDSKNAAKWKDNLVIGQEEYSPLTDSRNLNEIKVVVVNSVTKRVITGYTLSNIDRNTYPDIDGIVDANNFSPDMYFARVYKASATAKSGYEINTYFRFNIKPGVKTKVTIFIDPSKAMKYEK